MIVKQIVTVGVELIDDRDILVSQPGPGPPRLGWFPKTISELSPIYTARFCKPPMIAFIHGRIMRSGIWGMTRNANVSGRAGR